MKAAELIEIRVPANLGTTLKQAVTSGRFRESAVFGLASHARLRGKTLILVRKVIALPEEAYIPTSGHGAKWPGRAMLPILNEALEDRLGVILFHSHPHSGSVQLSGDDRQSAERLLPVFQNVIPSRPHASIVFGQDHAAGMVLMPDGDKYHGRVKVRWLGKAIVDFHSQSSGVTQDGDEEVYHRQMLLIKGEGQRILRHSKVAVVGLSGGGSHVVQQLAHMGLGEIMGIDGERVDSTNRSRVIGMTWLDVLLRRRKTNVMARMVRRINWRVKFTGVPHPVPHQQAIETLKIADVIIGCLDNLHARADVQEIAWRYLIPYVDIGLLIQPMLEREGVNIGGNVATLIPGEFCQWCIGFLSEEKLRVESGGRPRSYFEGTNAQAQVISFNGVLASQAVSEVLQLLTGFAPPDPEASIKKFNGLEGTLEKWVVSKKAKCSTCELVLGAGDVIWRPV